LSENRFTGNSVGNGDRVPRNWSLKM